MQFNEETFCPNVIDKSTALKKFLYCKKIDGLCKMVEYLPTGQMEPKQDVKTLGCPYGYAIQGIVEVKENDVLDDISKGKESPKQESIKKTPTKKKKKKSNNGGNKAQTFRKEGE